MKTVFDKPNEQYQARLDIAVARKRGLKAKLFLLGAMVCALGIMTACKSGTNVDSEQQNDTTAASSAKEYHFKNLKTPNSVQVVYIQYCPDFEKDSIELGEDRFIVYDDRAYYFSESVDYLENNGMKFDAVEPDTKIYNGNQQVVFLTEVGDVFIFVETADDGSNYIKFTCNPIDFVNGNVYVDGNGVWHNKTESACDWVEPI